MSEESRETKDRAGIDGNRRPGVSRRHFCRQTMAAAAALAISDWLLPRPAAGSGPCPEVAGATVQWIVPTPPGGGYDQYSRLISRFYETRLGARIVLEYVAGAGTVRGARRVMEAKPDGRTLGLVNAAALLISRVGGDSAAPDPVTELTILGRVSRTPQLWATGGDSGVRNLDDLYALARKRPIVFGLTEFGSTNPVSAVVASRILGLEYELVPGYQGTSGISLAAIRGEVDIAPLTVEARTGSLEAGDLTPILYFGMQPDPAQIALRGVPCLAGENGAAAVRAAAMGRDVEQARDDARALSVFLGAGRLAAAPRSLPPSLAACLATQLELALRQPDCLAAARLARLEIDSAGGEQAGADLVLAREAARRFLPLLEEARRRVRG